MSPGNRKKFQKTRWNLGYHTSLLLLSLHLFSELLIFFTCKNIAFTKGSNKSRRCKGLKFYSFQHISIYLDLYFYLYISDYTYLFTTNKQNKHNILLLYFVSHLGKGNTLVTLLDRVSYVFQHQSFKLNLNSKNTQSFPNVFPEI